MKIVTAFSSRIAASVFFVILSLTAFSQSPQVSTNKNSLGLSSGSVNFFGTINDTGAVYVDTRGFSYKLFSAAGTPDTFDSKFVEYGMFGSDTFSGFVSGLNPETRYKFNAFANNSFGLTYSNTYDFFTHSVDPNAHPAAFSSSTTSITQIDLSFSAASTITNADGYLIVQRQGSAPVFIPEDGETYSVGSTNGIETIVAIINNTTSTSASVSNLTAGQAYYYKIYPFNWDGTNSETINYLTTAGVKETNSSTIVSPTVTTSQNILNITDDSAYVSGAITNTGAQNASARGFCYKLYSVSGDPTTVDNILPETGNFQNGSFNGNLISLSSETQYKFRAYATNNAGTGYGQTYDFFTLSTQPSNHSSTFTSSTTSTTQIDLSFSAASTITNADGYIILQRQGAAPTGKPLDGEAYAVGNSIGNGYVAAIITNTSATTAIITSVSAGNNYYFKIYPFNWDGNNSETYNYLETGAIPSTSSTTIVTPTVTTSQNIENIASSSVDVTVQITNTGGENAAAMGVAYKAFATGDPTIADDTTEISGTYGIGSKVLNLTSLNPETQYKVRGYAYNTAGVGYGQTYDFYTYSTVPSAHSSTFSANTTSTTQIDLSFDAANTITNADGYLILQRQGSSPTGLPENGMGYTIGSSIGNGSVAAIINNTSTTTASITSVSAGNTYYFVIIPYNWDGSNAETYNYYTGGSIPSANASTVVSPTVTTNSNIDVISTDSVVVEGNITSNGGAIPTARGFAYKQYYGGDPTISDSVVSETGTFSTGIYDLDIVSLSAETRYKVAAYATNTAGTSYGQTYDFYTFSNEPAGHPTTFAATTASTNQVNLSFSAASTITDADGYIVIQRQGAAPTSRPVDGQAYTVGNSIGNGTVVSIISTTSATTASVTSVSAGNTYYYKIFPYNWDGTNAETYNYKTNGSVKDANAATIVIPSVTTSQNFTNIAVNSADATGNVTNNGGGIITTRGFVYKVSSAGDPTLSDIVENETGTYTQGTYSLNLTSLSPETKYKARAYAANSAGNGFGQSYEFYTLSTEPSTYPSNFTAETVTTNQIDLLFDSAGTIANCDGYIILKKQGSAPTGQPTDATAYSTGAPIGNGTVAAIITTTNDTSVSITSVSAGNTYYFSIIPYNWDGNNAETYNYKVDGTIPVRSAQTIVKPVVTTSTTKSNQTNLSIDLGGNVTNTGGSIILERGIVYKLYSQAGDPTYADQKVFQTGTFGPGNFTQNLTSLSPATQYKYAAFAINTADTGYGAVEEFFTLANEPANHSASFTATTSSTTQIELSFDRANTIFNAAGYLIIQRQGQAPTGLPSDATAYSVGSPIGNGTVAAIITSATQTSVSITSVSAGNTYYFILVPFNWDGANAETYNYYTGGTIPSANSKTVIPPTVTTSTNVSNISNTAATVEGTIVNTGAENPNVRGFAYKTFSAGDPDTSNMKVQQTGSFTPAGFSLPITGLTPETRYKYRAYAINSAGVSYGNTYDYYTIANEPTAHTSKFVAITSSTTQIDLFFDAASTITNADGYIILQKQGSAPNGVPEDATAYFIGSPISDGTVAAIISNSTDTTTSITSVSAGNTYYFTIIPFSWNGGNAETYNYYTGGSIPVANSATVAVPIVSTSATIININENDAELQGNILNTGGSNVVERGIVYKIFSAGDPDTSDFVNKETGIFSTGSYTRNLTGLGTQTRYKARAYAINSAGVGYGNTYTFYTLSTEPISNATKLNATAFSTTQIDLNFDPANIITNAKGYIIVQTQGTPLVGLPDDAVAYTVGNPVGNGVVVSTITDAAKTYVNITALNAGTKYYYTIFPYNWDGTNAQTYNYFTSTIKSANATTKQPCPIKKNLDIVGSTVICVGDSVSITADTAQGLSYIWTLNGSVLTGEDSSTLVARESGEYRAFISNSFCSVGSNPFNLTYFPVVKPVIYGEGQIRPCSNDTIILSTTSFDSFYWNTGESTRKINVTQSGNFTVRVRDIYGCIVESEPFTVNITAGPKPEICIVTVDTSTSKNLIAWEKPQTNFITAYRVYKESTQAGKYNLISTRDYNDLSVVLDTASNPIKKADRYYITALDTCGNESAPSRIHKTMHLTVNKGVNESVNLIWDHYLGFDFKSYNIYRGTKPDSMVLIDSIQNNLTSFTDVNPPGGVVFYQVAVVKKDTCYPTILRAQTTSGPFSQSLSNIKDFSANANYLEVSPIVQTLEIDSGSAATFTVYTTLKSWEAKTTDSWITVKRSVSTNSIVVYVTENKSDDPRQGNVTVSGVDVDDVILTINQVGKVSSVEEDIDQTTTMNIYPNPFNEFTNIYYELNKRSNVRLEVFDMMGKLVEVLADESQIRGCA
jgi:hypothetical protein